MSDRVLLTGSTGFQGSAILRALGLHDASISLLTRSDHRASEQGRGTQKFIGDIRDPAIVQSAIEGVDTIVHAASYIGNVPSLCYSVNVQGTRTLVESAIRHGVKSVIYLSTTAVYGSGPHRGERPDQLTSAPESELSRSRATAEKIVLDAGGLVIRPNLVLGVGDRWVLFAVVDLVRRLGGLVNNGEALLSVIKSDDLGELVASLASQASGVPGGRVFHAGNIKPVSVHELVSSITDAFGLLLPRQSTSHIEAISIGRSIGLTPHQVGLISMDHWYDAEELWEASLLPSPAKFCLSKLEIEWYRTGLAK